MRESLVSIGRLLLFLANEADNMKWPKDTRTQLQSMLRDVGSLTDEYSLTADQDDVWLTGGTEADVIAEARLDQDSIFAGVQRFARERPTRLGRQRAFLSSLEHTS